MPVAWIIVIAGGLGCDVARGAWEGGTPSRSGARPGAADARASGDPRRTAWRDSTVLRASVARDGERAGAARAIDRVAGLDADRLFAVAGERLLRLRGGRWEPLAIDGGVARDVQRARGALWLLVEGRGPNEGRVMVLRSEDGDGLALAAVAATPTREAGAWSVRGLAVAAGGFYVTGVNPALAFVTAGRVRVDHAGGGSVWTSVVTAQDDAVIAGRTDGAFEVLRYGTRETVERAELLGVLVGSSGVSHVAHRDGAIWRGRPGRELRRVVGAPPFEPAVVVALGDDRFAAVARGGPYASAPRGGAWSVLPGDWPSDPVAIVPCDPPLVVGRSGRVVAVEGTGRVVAEGL